MIGLESRLAGELWNYGGGDVVDTMRPRHTSGCGAEVSLSNHHSSIQIDLGQYIIHITLRHAEPEIQHTRPV